MSTRARWRRFGPVTVTNVASADGQWTTEQAIDLLAQGYTVDRVVQLTGYERRWITAQHRRLFPT